MHLAETHLQEQELTPEQQRAVELLAQGFTVAEVAHDLEIAIETVERWNESLPFLRELLRQREAWWQDWAEEMKPIVAEGRSLTSPPRVYATGQEEMAEGPASAKRESPVEPGSRGGSAMLLRVLRKLAQESYPLLPFPAGPSGIGRGDVIEKDLDGVLPPAQAYALAGLLQDGLAQYKENSRVLRDFGQMEDEAGYSDWLHGQRDFKRDLRIEEALATWPSVPDPSSETPWAHRDIAPPRGDDEWPW